MAGGQLPAEVEEFATYLRGLTRRLDSGAGWYGVFALRDPDGLRACLDGLEVPPWDLVQSLLQDLSAQHGPGAAQEAASRAATLYRASVAAHDAGPGRPEALRGRLDGMLRQRRNAAQRSADLRSALSTAEDPAARHRLAAELAWAHDDYQRATARAEELHARLAALPGVSRPTQAAAAGPTPPSPLAGAPAPATGGVGRGERPQGAVGFAVAYEAEGGGAEAATGPGAASLGYAAGEGGGAEAATGSGVASLGYAARDQDVRQPGGAQHQGDLASAGPDGGPAVAGGDEPNRPSAASPGPVTAQHAPAPARPRPRGARFAGVEEADAAPRPRGARFAGAGDEDAAVVPTPASPAAPSAESGAEARATPRGARFAGAYEGEDGGKRRKRDRVADDGRRLAREAAERAAARSAAQEAVARLGRLRAEGRSGEAHVVLYEAAVWPAARLPVLAEELERAGLGADVSTLLWEMACLPPLQLAAAAEALFAADREAEGEGLLRQSVSRPVSEVAHTAKALLAAGAPSRAGFLLEALVRVRTPEDAARAAAEDPATLVPLLLDVAAEVSSSAHHDLAHALRAARLPGVPGLA
ncbi:MULTISPECIES: serine/threonine-protein kinase [Streptomyces violaceusniger group]|uniref:UL36 very large tegument protein n=1 Tax=Streptomyces rhizosphaericus TaxID=114699 RepID=A0ABN1SR86_9ACTN|nr:MULTISPECIES: hypothetical protein [Streptomyces violaceusniger group]